MSSQKVFKNLLYPSTTQNKEPFQKNFTLVTDRAIFGQLVFTIFY
jgi:hypothetical protein